MVVGERFGQLPVLLALPFMGRWLVQNSPARRVPSHGTDLWGGRYAIDFVGVDENHRSAARTDWRTAVSTEPPGRFFAFGRPILAPAGGQVVQVHDGEADHEARRSQLTLALYALGQPARLRNGVGSVAGNFVILALDPGVFVALVHLRRGSLAVHAGDRVVAGQLLAECGNSGNSTQPHLHVQAMDRLDLTTARGIPVIFDSYREWPHSGDEWVSRRRGVPRERAVIEPLARSINP